METKAAEGMLEEVEPEEAVARPQHRMKISPAATVEGSTSPPMQSVGTYL